MTVARISMHVGPVDAFTQGDDTFVRTAAAFADFARSRGYEAHRLLGAEATWSALVSAARDAAERLAPDGEYLMTYCGHGIWPVLGCYVKDTQAWALMDVSPTEEVFARTLEALFQPGQRVVLVNDSCYSSGWGDLERIKSLVRLFHSGGDPDERLQIEAQLNQLLVHAFGGRSLESLGHLLDLPVKNLCILGAPPACRRLHLAAASHGKTAVKGAFSATLLDLMRAPPASYVTLIEAAQQQLGPDQVPRLEGNDPSEAKSTPF